MSPDLKQSKGKRCGNNIPTWISDAILKSRYLSLHRGKCLGHDTEEDTPSRDKGELNDGEGDRLWKGIEDRFGGCVRQG